VKLWDVASEALRQTLSGHDSMVISVALSPNGKLLASGSLDKTIMLWRRKENVTGSTGREASVEATVSQMVRSPAEVRENPKDGLKMNDFLTIHHSFASLAHLAMRLHQQVVYLPAVR
jgi:WD40 repeat protein